MLTFKRLSLISIPTFSLALMLAACGPQDGGAANAGQAVAAPKPAAVTPAASQGVVTAVTPIVTADKPSGAGAVVGGVLGAAVGNQIGGGNGRKVATVIGAVGGAKVGHEVEKQRSTHVTGYRVDVKLDNGATHSFTLTSTGGFATGQRVRVVDGQVLPA